MSCKYIPYTKRLVVATLKNVGVLVLSEFTPILVLGETLLISRHLSM